MTEPTEAMIEAGANEFPVNGFGIDRTFLARSYLAMKALDSDTHRAAPTDAVEALTFYATEWTRVSTALGLAGPDKIITHRLACDYGERARAALAAMSVQSDKGEGR